MAIQKHTKEKIIKKCNQCIAKNPKFMYLNLNAILEELDISKGSFYYYFKSKDDLIYQAINPRFEELYLKVQKSIIKSQSLKEQLCHFFFPAIDSTLESELIYIENNYKYLFFEENIKKSKILRKLFLKGRKQRKNLILKIIKLNGIKINKEASILMGYMMDTVISYTIFHKILYDKYPRQEIIEVIDTLCNLIESKNING
ncbi:MAG: TetR/AcrR family transcriptional regulator [Helicobacteraceae bacterium]|nr:TetR/AcrR family transcriptional regulator [Helicobacteraceae bacterium]